jgi:SecD/SecF fusion protein
LKIADGIQFLKLIFAVLKKQTKLPMRALVSIFAALLIVISLYQLSFTWFVNSHESAMEAKAKRQIGNLYPSAASKYPGNK